MGRVDDSDPEHSAYFFYLSSLSIVVYYRMMGKYLKPPGTIFVTLSFFDNVQLVSYENYGIYDNTYMYEQSPFS